MKTQSKDIISIVFLISLLVLLIIFGPLAIIWSLNTLFPVLAIPIGFYQWLAVIVLNSTVFAKSILSFKKD